MALFKVLKGQEANLPTEKKEGWAYVTYAETTIPAGQQYGEGSMYVDVSDNNRIKINMHADMASMDDQHQSITGTYIKDVTLENGASAPYYKLKYGNNMVSDATHAPLPIASATNAGILTADTVNTQILTGPKEMDENGSLTIKKSMGFNYSGIQSSSGNEARTVWFSHGQSKGIPVRNDKFVYNPDSTDPWNGYGSEVTGTATTAHGVLTAERLQGIAYQAFLDTNKVKITSYLHGITLVQNPTQPYYTVTKGDNISFNVNLPVASLAYAGVVTTDMQILTGQKIFVAEDDVSTWGSDFDEIMLREYEAYYTGQGDLPDGQISIFSNSHAPLQLMSTNQPGLIIKNGVGNSNPPIVTDNSALVDNLNVDLLDGFHASNATFEWSTADAASEQILPTRSAICRSLNNLLQASQALYYKGTIDPTNSSSIPSSAKVGDVYIFSKAGTCFSQNVEAGDMAICSAVNGNTITWNIIQMNIDGAVRSSTSSTTNGEIVLFDGTSGKIVKNSNIYTVTFGYNDNKSIYIYGSGLMLGLNRQNQRLPIDTVYATHIIANNITSDKYLGAATLTGTPTAPTAAAGTSTTQIATTEFVTSAISTLNTNMADIYVLKTGDSMTGFLEVPSLELNRLEESTTIDAARGYFTTLNHISNTSLASDIFTCIESFFNGTGPNANTPMIISSLDATQSLNTRWFAYVFSPNQGMQIHSNGNSSWALSYFNTTTNGCWAIQDDGTFSGTADYASHLYISNDDTSSKKYVLGAADTGQQTVYSESSVYMESNVLYGAAWNDYAEFRQGDTLEPGKCVVEAGDDTLTLATGRMIPGASIISDTFGFSIGETEKCKTPIAVSGRVLAYPYESREEFRKNIGRPVCSGPNGTVSIMTDEEYRVKGYCALGTISAVPDYEEWGTGNVKVNNRVWIHVK